MLRNSTRHACVAAVAVLAAAFAGSAVAAPPYKHIDRLARQLEKGAREFHKEVDAHFRRTPQFKHLDSDARQMEQLARHVHEVAHNEGDIGHVRSDLKKLDRLFHHVEEVVDDLARSRGADRQAVRHLRRSLKEMGDTLHHLRDHVK